MNRNISDLKGNIKRSNIHVVRNPQNKKSKEGAKNQENLKK